MRDSLYPFKTKRKQNGGYLLALVLLIFTSIQGFSQDLGKGFFDHGVAVPISNHRGTVATVDGNGRNVVLVWLFDHRGGYGLLQIDAETGKTKQFPIPFKLDLPYGDAPYGSILSSKNKFYTLFNDNFTEFDPVKGEYTFTKQAAPRMGMGMTEDEKGVIWTVTYPNSGVISFNPTTKEFKDYGSVYNQNWKQYPRYIAADDAGWIYFAIGNTASQIVAFNPISGKSKPMLDEAERKRGTAYVYRDTDGKVYGQSIQGEKEEWLQFYKGERSKADNHRIKPVLEIAGSQSLFHRVFPDGRKIKEVDLVNRKLTIENPGKGTVKQLSFDYDSDGALIMGVGRSPDGQIVGGTAFPMRFFHYNPKTNAIQNTQAFDQFNAMGQLGNRFYFGLYPHGDLLEWDPSKPWVNTKKDAVTNPLLLADGNPLIYRPSRVHAASDKKTIIMSGTPDYGYTGGGLLFWDTGSKTKTLLPDTAVVIDQSTLSLVNLSGGKLLGGTTTQPGTGGEKKAKEAELYIMDLAKKKVEWHQPLLPGIQNYSDMLMGPDGLVYGIADSKKLFVFDPVKRTIVHQEDVSAKYGVTTSAQSPRIFVTGPNKEIYLLFVKGIVKLEPGSFKTTLVAKSPVDINAGGDYMNGKIYFVSGSHIISYKLR